MSGGRRPDPTAGVVVLLPVAVRAHRASSSRVSILPCCAFSGGYEATRLRVLRAVLRVLCVLRVLRVVSSGQAR